MSDNSSDTNTTDISGSDDDQQYWDLVEGFINSANDACDNADPGLVAAALLNAAARFNALSWRIHHWIKTNSPKM